MGAPVQSVHQVNHRITFHYLAYRFNLSFLLYITAVSLLGSAEDEFGRVFIPGLARFWGIGVERQETAGGVGEVEDKKRVHRH